MHKIWLIIQREYLTRVRKKSFIIMTLVGPLLMAALMLGTAWLATVSDDSETIEVLDESGLLGKKLQSEGELKFRLISGSVEAAKKRVTESENTSLLYIPKFDLDKPEGIKLFSQENASLTTQIGLEKMLKREIEAQKFARSGVDQKVLDQIKTDIDISTINLSDGDEKNSNA